MTIPVAMKLSPYFSAFANMAVRLDKAGADALVLFNRFLQPDVDLDTLELVRPRRRRSPLPRLRPEPVLPLRGITGSAGADGRPAAG